METYSVRQVETANVERQEWCWWSGDIDPAKHVAVQAVGGRWLVLHDVWHYYGEKRGEGYEYRPTNPARMKEASAAGAFKSAIGTTP